MKTLYATLIVLVLAFGLVGCAQDNDDAAPAPEAETTDANDTNESNETPPLGTGYAGRGNIEGTTG